MARDLFEEAGISPAGGRDLFKELGISPEKSGGGIKDIPGNVRNYGLGIAAGAGEGVASTEAGVGTFLQAPAASALSGILGARALADRGITSAINYALPGTASPNPDYQQAAQQASAFAAEQRARNVSDGQLVARLGLAMQNDGRERVEGIQSFNREFNPELVRQQQAMSETEGFAGALRGIMENPLAFTHTLARSAPDMVAGAGVARGVAKGIAAAGGSAARQVAGASTAGIMAESASSANQARESVFQQVAGMPLDRLAASPRYREILRDVGNPERAREALANELADQAPILAGAGTALGSVVTNRLFGGDTTAKMLAGAERTTGKAVAKNIAQEGVEEGLQGVPEDLAQHGAVVQADPKKKFDLYKTLAENMAAGVAMGAGGSGMAYARDNKRNGSEATHSEDPAIIPDAGNDPANPPAVVPPPATEQTSNPTTTAQNPAQERQAAANHAVSPEQLSQAATRLSELELLRDSRALTPEESAEESGLRTVLENGDGAPGDRRQEAERALYTPASLTALDRVTEIDAALPNATPEDAATLQSERDRITQTWPQMVAGAPARFTTEAGAGIDGQYALMEAGDMVASHDENLRPNPVYPQDLQPRDRERAASEMQVSGIVQKIDPARLGLSADAATGAPIVGADGLVESGNARTVALKRVYQANGAKADSYKQFLKDNAAQFGLTTEAVDAMQKPVLVRVRSTPVNRAEFARQANASTVAQMSTSEQAKSDASRMDILDDLQPDENGDFSTSRDFIRRFMAKLPVTEQAGMIDAAGRLSQAGYARIRNAVLAKAYGDSPVLTRMVESMDDNLRNVGKALLQAAPEVARMRQDVAQGALFDADITPDLMAAVTELSELRAAGISTRDALAQAGLFGEKYSPETRELLQFLSDNIRRPRAMADFLRRYVEALRAAGNPNQSSLFGETTAPGKGELLAVARGRENAAEDTRRTDAGKNEGIGGQGAGQSADAQRGEGRAQGDEGAGRPAAGDAGEFGLEGQSPADLKRQEDERVAAEKAAQEQQKKADEAERREKEQAEVRRRSEFAASTFQLGQDGMDNLTGQGGLFESNSSGGSENQKADSASKGLESRRALTSDDTKLTSLLTLLAEHDDLFQQPAAFADTPEEIGKEIDPDYPVRKLGPSSAREKGVDVMWEIGVPNSKARSGYLYQKGNEVWLDVSRLLPHIDSGNIIYGIAAGYAHNTGRVLIGDPAGLSRLAFFRRTENMISSILKYGTSDHLEPHRAQIDPATYYHDEGHTEFGQSVRAVDWEPGNTAHNLRELLYTSYQGAMKHVPELKNVTYDFGRRTFVRAAPGGARIPVTGDFFSNVSERVSTRPNSPYRAGSATLKRAALVNTLVRGQTAEEWGQSVAAARRQLRGDGLDSEIERIFYSKTDPAKTEQEASQTPPTGSAPDSIETKRRLSFIKATADKFSRQFKGASALDIRVVPDRNGIPAGYRPSPYAEGVYHGDSGTIYLIAKNLPTAQRAWQVLMHEAVGHYGLANLMGENFASLQSLVMEKARASRVLESAPAVGDADYATIDAVRLLYPNASESEVAQEVLARMAETMQKTSWFNMLLARVRTWARSMAEAVGIQWNPTLQDARDMVTLAARHLQKGSNLATNAEPTGLVAASNRKDDPEFTETERAYGGREAYDRAKSSGRTKLNYRQYVQVRTPEFKAWFGDWEISGSVPKRQASTFDEARVAAKTFQGNPLTNGATGIVATVSRNSLDKMLSGKAVGKSESPATHSLAVANLDALFERAMLGWSKPDSEGDPNIKAIHRFFTPVMVDGRAMLAKMTVKETGLVGDPNPLYTVEAISFDEMKNPAAQWVAEIAGADGIDPKTIRSAGLIESMAQRVQEFKPDTVSKITDPETGEPLVVYHGTNADFDAFDNKKTGANDRGLWGRGHYFTSGVSGANSYAERQGDGAQVIPAFISLKNPLVLTTSRDLVTRLPDGTNYRELVGENLDGSKIKGIAQSGGHDGVIQIKPDGFVGDLVAFSPTQIKSATGNNGAFDGSNPSILESRAIPSVSELAKRAEPHLENLVYNYQDKYIDLKNVQTRIKEMGGTLTELNDAYLGEEMYHSRVMKKTHDFAERELKPLLTQLFNNKISKEDFEQYLHARHAPEANKALAERNPNRRMILETQERIEREVKALEVQLGQAKARGNATQSLENALKMKREEAKVWKKAQAFDGTEEERLSLSGMSDAEAAQVMSGIPAGKRSAYESAAKKVDAIVEGTRAEQERSGLTSKAEVDAWRAAYQHYVPLYRDEAHPDSVTHSIGQGFSVRGAATKRRTGSNEKVTNILGHIALQRESTITRSEKNMVAKRLYLLAAQNPIKGFWQVGLVPKIKTIDPDTGTVRSSVDPTYLGKPNVLAVRIAGKDTAVIFDERNPEAMRLAGALKNMDGKALEDTTRILAMGTRWFASVNTQYNPIFGVVNLARDVQGALINLSSTEIAAQKKAVFDEAMRLSKEVLKAKFDLDKLPAADRARWEEFQDTGGATGFRDLFANPEDRAKALEKEFNALGRGKTSQKLHRAAEFLSDFNESMENVVRLSAYKIALDNGMSKARAASLAKNITVNFNRKGAKSTGAGAWFAFFNASIQGTARMSQALRSPAGKKIILGGIMLGVLQQLAGMLLMGGGDDDQWEKIPDFIKEKNMIFPISRTTFISIPMPLGYNVLPNIGRLFTEFALGGSDKPTGKQLVKLFDATVGAFNPLGGTGFVDTITPTVFDPVASLLRNRDWTNRPIYREDMNQSKPTPGHTRTKDSATPWAKGGSWLVNKVSGGTDYQKGGWSPTPDQIDYVLGQLSGGVGREIGKAAQTGAKMLGLSDDELPMHKIPLFGRFVGSTDGVSGQSEKFYDNVKELNGIQAEITGRWKNNEDAEGYIKSEPLSDLVGLGDAAELQIKTFRVLRKQLKKEEDTAGVKEVDLLIAETMKDLNMAVRRARQ